MIDSHQGLIVVTNDEVPVARKATRSSSWHSVLVVMFWQGSYGRITAML